MSSRYLHLVRMDVAHDLEPTFNEVYDTEHAPLLQAVPGIAAPRATGARRPPIPATSPPTSSRARGAAECRVEDGR